MKLDIKDDFTRLPRATSIILAGDHAGDAFDHIELPHDERHLRRKVLPLAGGGKILADLPDPVQLGHGDRLILEDGRQVEVQASPEDLYAIHTRSPLHWAELCWHIGNRHLAVQIEEARLLILRDHVIRDMLIGLGADVADVVEPFQPVRGAYSGHSHGHDHHHEPDHGERDSFGRLPGDPHYGHSHG